MSEELDYLFAKCEKRAVEFLILYRARRERVDRRLSAVPIPDDPMLHMPVDADRATGPSDLQVWVWDVEKAFGDVRRDVHPAAKDVLESHYLMGNRESTTAQRLGLERAAMTGLLREAVIAFVMALAARDLTPEYRAAA